MKGERVKMNDLISRQALCEYALNQKDKSITPNDIMRFPSAQPQRMKGRWVRKESDLSWWYECSECGESPLFDPYENEVLTRFCPWCGAEMETE